MISQKNVQMLAYLCSFAKERQYIRVEDLASRFRVSTRTVRYDLDNIDYYLRANNYPKLERVKGSGVMLNVPQEMIERIGRTLCQMQADTYVLSRLERALYIRMLLFDAQTPMKYEELAEKLYVSRKTVIEDVRTIKEEDESCDAQISSAKNGIFYQGSELQLRRTILDRILELFTPIELWELVSGIYLNRSVAIEKKWVDIMGTSNASAMEEVLRQTEEAQKVVLSDDQFYLTVLLTVLACNRTNRQCALSQTLFPSVDLPQVLEVFFRRLENVLGLCLPWPERQYVALEMSRILNDSGRERAEKLADIVTENLLVRVSDELDRKYFLDNTLRMGLREHLIAVIKNGSSRRNEDEITIQTVIREHTKLFACIHSCLDQIKGLRLNRQEESESALIALHFCAAEERRLMTGNCVYKALVVCANGIGTSKIVSATVEKHFPQIQVVDTPSIHNVQTIVERDRPDFILTTVPLTCRNTPVIHVNTLLSDADLDRIRNFILASKKSGSDYECRDIYEELWNTVADTCEIRDHDGLERGLLKILGIEKKHGSSLLNLVREEGILLGLESEDWESAVRGSAEPLVESGYLEPRYVQAMVDNIREMGPYIVITPGIAMPHSLPKDGVLRSCMGIAVLKHPVNFGNEANDPVRVVMCMGALDNQEHMKEMSDLINLFSDETAVEQICSAESRHEVINILRKYSRS